MHQRTDKDIKRKWSGNQFELVFDNAVPYHPHNVTFLLTTQIYLSPITIT